MQPFVFSCWLSLWRDGWLLQFHPKTQKDSDSSAPIVIYALQGARGIFLSLCLHTHKITKC